MVSDEARDFLLKEGFDEEYGARPLRRAIQTNVDDALADALLAEEIAAARANKDVNLILVDAAVMVEAGWSEHCDRILFVDAPRELRLRRLAGQRGWSPKEVEARESAQMPLDEKKARADAVLENSGTVEGLQEQVEQLLRRWGIRK